jgi:alpha-D-xyloside xylohydrolase
MFGPALLINPVYQYKARTREVYLPENSGWYDLNTGKYFKGGQTMVADAPMNKMPVYVREGSIVPTGPAIQYTNEKPADPLTVYVYQGKDGRFDLYEDDGTNYKYEQGQYSVIPFEYDEESKTLTIGDRKGEYSLMLSNRKIRIVWVDINTPVGMDLEEVRSAQVIDYDGRAQQIKIN